MEVFAQLRTQSRLTGVVSRALASFIFFRVFRGVLRYKLPSTADTHPLHQAFARGLGTAFARGLVADDAAAFLRCLITAVPQSTTKSNPTLVRDSLLRSCVSSIAALPDLLDHVTSESGNVNPDSYD